MKQLHPHQRQAADSLHNGSVLVGGTGSGKSLTGLAFYFEKIIGGSLIDPPSLPTMCVDLFIFTTAMKRDSMDWQKEAAELGISSNRNYSVNDVLLTVDSWNNIHKYTNIKNAFFIFDEQKTIGTGAWTKSFIAIAKHNQWIMLSATPADRWTDLIAVFIANGFYKNKSDFARQHIIYEPYVKFPKIKSYINTDILLELKHEIFVFMPFEKKTTRIITDIPVIYDKNSVKISLKKEWNPYTNSPVQTLSEHAHVLRKIINTDASRIVALNKILEHAKKVIVFYNFDYELEAIKNGAPTLITVAEHNGHRHDAVPTSDSWLYLVQYNSGNEAWECFTTNHMVFYSLNHSYRITTQSMGRIDRMNTIYKELYYYRFVTDSFVDKGILSAYNKKKDFNSNAMEAYITTAKKTTGIIEEESSITNDSFFSKKPLESNFKNRLKKDLLKKYPNSIIISPDPVIHRSIPDLIFLNNTFWAALEVKRDETSSARPNQELIIDTMNTMSFGRIVYPQNKETVLHDLEKAQTPGAK